MLLVEGVAWMVHREAPGPHGKEVRCDVRGVRSAWNLLLGDQKIGIKKTSKKMLTPAISPANCWGLLNQPGLNGFEMI